MSASVIIGSAAPGVHARINAGQIMRPAPPASPSTAFAVGYSGWGPVNTPTVITSWQEFVRTFGPFNANSFLDDFCYIYFNLYPGTRAVICRVVGTSPVVGTLSVVDRHSTTPTATIRFDAKYPSSSVDVKIKIEDGTQADTFKLTVKSDALGTPAEIFDNLKTDAASILRVNQNSQLVVLTNLANGHTAPANLPALTAETALAGGDDKFSTINAATMIGSDDGTTRTGLQAFNSEDYGPGQVAIPGMTTDTVHAALVAHAEAWKRLALLDVPLGATKATAVSIRSNYSTGHGAIHWPRPQLLDFAGTDTLKYYPTSGFIAGECAKADLREGPHRAPANLGPIPNALDVERASNGQPQTDTENVRAYLNDNQVNVITPLYQQGVKVYGARVMSTGLVQTISAIRTLCLIYYQLKSSYQQLPFAVVDASGSFYRQVKSITESYLRTLYRAGAFAGEKESKAFVVNCDRNNNPADELDAGRVHVQVGVIPVGMAEFIYLDIQAVPQTQDLTVLQS